MSDSLRPHELQPSRLLRPWDFPGKNTGMGCHFLLQGIFPTQGLNPGLLHCRQTLHHLSHQEAKLMLVNDSLVYFASFIYSSIIASTLYSHLFFLSLSFFFFFLSIPLFIPTGNQSFYKHLIYIILQAVSHSFSR